jgi:hypothetical protein
MEPDVSDRPDPEPAPPTPVFQPLETVRVTMQNFDGLLRSAGGLLAESQRQSHVTAQLNGIARQLSGMEKEAEYVRRCASVSLRRGRGHTRVRAFLDSMESQTRALARQTSEVRRLHQRSSWTMTGLGKQLQNECLAGAYGARRRFGRRLSQDDAGSGAR